MFKLQSSTKNLVRDIKHPCGGRVMGLISKWLFHEMKQTNLTKTEVMIVKAPELKHIFGVSKHVLLSLVYVNLGKTTGRLLL